MARRIPGLSRLARACGVATSYVDLARVRRTASHDALLAVLRSMGAPVERAADVPAALVEHEARAWRRALEPVAVAWDGKPRAIELRRPADEADARAEVRIEAEDGETRTVELAAGARTVRRATVDGRRYVAQRMQLPELPIGYHRVSVTLRGGCAESLLIAAPVQCWEPEPRREWGVFLPLYALRSASDWGIGDFGDLERLAEWVVARGGSAVATLPLLAAFVERPFDPSPYAPVSRLFWNECFLDMARVPGLEAEPTDELGRLRAADHVDYRGVAAARRGALTPLAHRYFQNGGAQSREFREFLRENPRAEAYARFRAACHEAESGWPGWAAPDAAERVNENGDAYRYHLFAQLMAARQLRDVARRVRDAGGSFYLDLPLGVRPDGFDVWQHRELFALGVSTGAPPDPFFSRGQSWGFPPFDPHALRESGYGYFRECVRNHMRYAGVLRLDHVMGLHRLFWIPPGGQPADGVYVRYPAEEMYAILALESHRHETMVVGEDLGTVPREVPRAMAAHALQRMSVLQFEVNPDSRRPLPQPPRARVASINTHDMPTFAAFWRGLDIDDRRDLGLLDMAGAAAARVARERVRQALARMLRSQRLLGEAVDDVEQVHAACLQYYGRSRARLVLCTLEDLWAETRPQNTPGTYAERPNWSRKARYPLEEFTRMPQVLHVLDALNASRGQE